MADYLTTDTELTSIANAIRTKGGTSSQLVYPTGFVSAIEAIPTGGGGAWQDVSSHFTYYDGTSTVEITALKNGNMVILLVTVTATETELDGRIAIDQGYKPASWFASPDGLYTLPVYMYDDSSSSYMAVDYAPYNGNEFDLAISSPISVTVDPVYLIGVYLVN